MNANLVTFLLKVTDGWGQVKKLSNSRKGFSKRFTDLEGNEKTEKFSISAVV